MSDLEQAMFETEVEINNLGTGKLSAITVIKTIANVAGYERETVLERAYKCKNKVNRWITRYNIS